MDWSLLGQGVLMTLWLTFGSWMLSLVLGILVAVLRIAPNRVLQSIGAAYTEIFRNIPLLVVLFLFYFGLPRAGILFNAETCAILGLGMYTAAYVAEVIRAGFNAVSRGNLEAARSLGLSFIQSVRYVQLPQALRSAIPPLGTLLIALVKNTSLAGAITVGDLLFQANVISGRTFNPYTLPVAGALYVAIIVPLALGVNALEHRWAIRR